MVIRAVIRDMLGLYLGYEILKGYLYPKSFQITDYILLAALAMFLMSIWFFLERVGILPKIT
jgi:uncharacterized protein YjaZ